MKSKTNPARMTSVHCVTMTIKEAAQLAGVSERFIRKLVKNNVLRPVQLPGVIRLNRREFLEKLREVKTL